MNTMNSTFLFDFGWMGIMMPLMFLLVFSLFVFVIIRGIVTWNKNNHSPRLIVQATVLSRRAEQHSSSGRHHHHTTRYYATFEVEGGDRLELALSGSEYGLLMEGDRGKLCFQGTRYLGFTRA